MNLRKLTDEVQSIHRRSSPVEIGKSAGLSLLDLGIRWPGEWWGSTTTLGAAIHKEIYPDTHMSVTYRAALHEIASVSFADPLSLANILIQLAAHKLFLRRAAESLLNANSPSNPESQGG